MTLAKLDDALGTAIQRLSQLADAHGSDALSIASQVAQAHAAGRLLACVSGFVLGLALFGAYATIWRRIPKTPDPSEDHVFARLLWGALLGLPGILLTLICGGYGLDGALWLAAFDGRAALAAQLLGLL